MSRNKITKLVAAVAIVLTNIGLLSAQNNTNSPYTMNGYGRLSDATPIAGQSMGGIGYGVRSKDFTNFINPASYTAIDSITFVLEGGVSLQNVNFKAGEARLNAKNSSLDYLTMHFRAKKWMAFSLGFLPYSNVGYSFNQFNRDEKDLANSSTITYAGDGGIHKAYFGVGFNIYKGLSIGANIAYLWGDINRTTSIVFPNNLAAFPYTRNRNISVGSYDIKLGAQYAFNFNKKHSAIIGLVYVPGHNISSGYTETTSMGMGASANITETETNEKSGIPSTIGVGATYTYNNSLMLGGDYTYENWSKTKFLGEKQKLANRHKLALGMEWYPNRRGHNFLSHVRYRMGGFYAKQYYMQMGQRMANEFGISMGFGIPIPRTSSMLNISGEYARSKGTNNRFATENILRIKVGLKFSQHWFMKSRVE